MAFIRRKGSGNQLTPEEMALFSAGKVVKVYKDKIVFAKPGFKPARKRKPTPAQLENRYLMAFAVAFAKAVNANPAKKAKWKKRAKGFTNVYQAVVSAYLKNPKKYD